MILKRTTGGNIRYISGGKDAQLESFTIPIEFVTTERNVVPNATHNMPQTVIFNARLNSFVVLGHPWPREI